jgi:hypothetical protein
MRENCLSGLTSGAWKRGMESLLRHRQTKGPDTDKTLLNYRATPRLYTLGKDDRMGKAGGFSGLLHMVQQHQLIRMRLQVNLVL